MGNVRFRRGLAVVLVLVIAGLTAPFVPARAATSPLYADAVLSTNPDIYYRLNESGGSVAADSSGNANTGTYDGPNATAGASSGLANEPGGKAVALNDWGMVYTTNALPNSNVLTQSAWIKTTTTSGGHIIGFTDERSAGPFFYDRRIWMSDDGRLSFGVYPTVVRVVSSSQSYNDGAWHHVAATLSPAGMHLYVDGALVGSRSDTTSGESYSGGVGWWRVGWAPVDGWPPAASAWAMAGQVDEPAVWNSRALTASEIRTQYSAAFAEDGTTTLGVEVLPQLAFGVGLWAEACNGVTPTGTASATTATLGRLAPGAPVSAAQELVVTENAGSGYTVYVSGGPMTGPAALAGVAGTNASPAAFGAGEGFGYSTYDNALLRFRPNKWAALDGTPQPVASAPGPAINDSNCVIFQAQASSTTAAGAYSTTVVYTAVPTF